MVSHEASPQRFFISFVTHGQEEAFTLSNRIAVMHDGRVE
jgi:ABC-type Fe3+/spermidine/putrescine transport system ATPase subunit